jgi:N-methylhydantoinase B/oxoprolinase/acetone carboxylase alpha subunit
MSAQTETIRQRIRQLVAYVEQGRIVDAIEEFYADGATMRENLDAPTVGKAANVQREGEFQAYVARWHHARAAAVIVDGDRAVIHWDMDYTGTDGKRWHYDQLALQRWEGAHIVEERFVYDPATVAYDAAARAA